MSPMGTLIKKTHRQEKLSVIQPPRGGTDGWGGHNRDTVEGEGSGSFVRRKGVDQDCLLYRARPPPPIPAERGR